MTSSTITDDKGDIEHALPLTSTMLTTFTEPQTLEEAFSTTVDPPLSRAEQLSAARDEINKERTEVVQLLDRLAAIDKETQEIYEHLREKMTKVAGLTARVVS